MHIFNLNHKPHLILSDKELLFRENLWDSEMQRHLFENIERISLLHRRNADKELFIWLQIKMHKQTTPLLVQLSSLDTPVDEILQILNASLSAKVKLKLPTKARLRDLQNNHRRQKYFGLAILSILLSLFVFHKFYPPNIDDLKENSLKAEYQNDRSFCSAKAKAAFDNPSADLLTLKSYCGVLGSWRETDLKEIPKKHLETEFSALKVPDYMTQAGKAIKNKAYAPAITSLEKALYLDPKNERVYTLLSFSHFLHGEKDLAMQHVQKALKLNPNSAEAHTSIALLYKDAKKNETAYAHLQKAALLHPVAKSYIALGEMELMLDKPVLAREHFEKSLEQDSNNTATLTQLGLLYWKSLDYEKAAEVFKASHAVDSNNSGLFLNYYEISMVTPTSLSTKDQEAFVTAFKDSKSSMMTYDMLTIIKHAIEKRDVQTAIQKWQQDYSGEKLDWSFDELKSWTVNSSISEEEKENIQKTIGVFIGHKQLYNLEHTRGLK